MFKAVRDRILGFGSRLGAAWQDLRGRGIVRLFVFEFTVVLLGVLAAQALQNWASDRSARVRLDASISRLDEAIGNNLAGAHAWDETVPCFRTRLREIMRYAGNGQDVPAEWLSRPAVRGTTPTALSAEEELLLRRVEGEDQARTFTEFEASRASLHRGVELIADRWQSLAVLDPDLGAVQPGDRVNAREAAAEMLSALRRIEIVADQLVEWGETHGYEPTYRTNRLPRSCEEIWDTGTMMPAREAG